MRRAIPLFYALVLVSGCTSSTSDDAPSVPPAPELAKFLHENYTVVSQFKEQLVPDAPDAVVVVSKGPGLTPGVPVPGGTGDVQVLAYDDQAKRWVLAFDAADQLAAIGDASAARPVLDQSHPLEDVAAQPVHFRGRSSSDLVVSGVDGSTNHPSNDVAIIRFGAGTAELAWVSDEIGTPTPVIEGTDDEQTVKVEASYYTDFDPACCPVRQYRQTLGVDADGNVIAVDDDRPYLGAYLTPMDPATAGAVVLGVELDSPAARTLQPGDRLLAIDGKAATEEGADLELPLLRVLAHKKAGDSIAVRLQRSEAVRTVRINLASVVTAPPQSPAAGQLGIGVLPEANFEIASIQEASPAAAAGLAVGDRIVSVNRRPIKEMLDFYIALWQQAGVSVPVVYRDAEGVSHTIQVVPEEAPDGPTTARL